jgi:hypothetical protein
MPPLPKTCPKMVPSHKGGSLCVKDAFAKKFFGVGRDSAGGALASVLRKHPSEGRTPAALPALPPKAEVHRQSCYVAQVPFKEVVKLSMRRAAPSPLLDCAYQTLPRTSHRPEQAFPEPAATSPGHARAAPANWAACNCAPFADCVAAMLTAIRRFASAASVLRSVCSSRARIV